MRCVSRLLSTRRSVQRKALRCRASRPTRMAATSETEAPPPPRKHVVTAVVRKQDGTVLLVQRSDQVGTFKGHWGGVSGFVEAMDVSLVARCLDEISEEVGFSSDDVRYVRSGRPLYVDSARHRFTVHPFLFAATAEELPAVQLNWENTDARFFLPEQLSQLETVPQLDLAVDRVVLPPSQEAVLRRLESDRAHGAAELAGWVVDALEAEAKRLAAASCGEADEEGWALLDTLRSFGYAMAVARPSMTPIANAAATVLAAAHHDLHRRATAFPPSRVEVGCSVQQAVRQYRAAAAARGHGLRQQVKELLRDGQTIMTLSRSSTVEQAVAEAAAGGMQLRAIICESRPLCEGVAVARAWAAAGVDCTLITDAQASIFVQQADMVLLGADSLTHEAVINKAGSALLALAAQAAQRPCYAVADTSKLSAGRVFDLAHPPPQAGQQQAEEMDPAEVTAAWEKRDGQGALPSSVHVRNVYFESVPLGLLEAVVTEEGRLSAGAIRDRVVHLEEIHRTAFDIRSD